MIDFSCSGRAHGLLHFTWRNKGAEIRAHQGKLAGFELYSIFLIDCLFFRSTHPQAHVFKSDNAKKSQKYPPPTTKKTQRKPNKQKKKH